MNGLIDAQKNAPSYGPGSVFSDHQQANNKINQIQMKSHSEKIFSKTLGNLFTLDLYVMCMWCYLFETVSSDVSTKLY